MEEILTTSEDVVFEQKLQKLSWFIRIRYIAPSLFWLFTSLASLPNILRQPEFYTTTLFLVIFILYNAIIHIIVVNLKKDKNRKKVNLNYFVLIQAVVDSIVLTAYIYLDGGIESPVFIAYALVIVLVAFLTNKKTAVIYITIVSILYSIVLLFEFYGIIPHIFARGDHIDLYANQMVVFTDGIFIVIFLFVLIFSIRYLNRESSFLELNLKKALSSYWAVKEQYEDITENAFDFIQSIDNKGQILYVNKQWRESLGYSKEEVLNMKIFTVIDKSDAMKYKRIMDKLTRTKQDQKCKVSYITKEGKKIILEGTISAKFDDEGVIISTREILRDVTSNETNDKKHEIYLKNLEQLNKAMVGRELKMIEMQKEIDTLKKGEEQRP